MKLELGAGENPTPGFTHLDARELSFIEIVDDAATLEKIPEESCDAILAKHLLEHFSHRDTQAILKVWLARLKPGGSLRVEVPNLEGHVAAWADLQSTDAQFVEYLYGSQDYDGNYHKTAFTPRSLDRALRVAGYREIEIHNYGLAIMGRGKR